MRREDLAEALDHLRAVLVLEKDIGDPKITVIAGLWKARCLRKAGEYEQALEVTTQSMTTGREARTSHLAAFCAHSKAGWCSSRASRKKPAAFCKRRKRFCATPTISSRSATFNRPMAGLRFAKAATIMPCSISKPRLRCFKDALRWKAIWRDRSPTLLRRSGFSRYSSGAASTPSASGFACNNHPSRRGQEG